MLRHQFPGRFGARQTVLGELLRIDNVGTAEAAAPSSR